MSPVLEKALTAFIAVGKVGTRHYLLSVCWQAFVALAGHATTDLPRIWQVGRVAASLALTCLRPRFPFSREF